MSQADVLARKIDNLDELDRVLSAREDVLSLLGNVILQGLPQALAEELPPPPAETNTLSSYLRDVARRLDAGGTAGASILMREAARLFPGRIAASAPPAAARSATVSISLDEHLPAQEILGLVRASQGIASSLGRRASLDLVAAEGASVCLSFEGATDEEAELIASRIQSSLRPGIHATVEREPHGFRDYFLDPIWAVGPDGARFSLDHVRASTPLVDVAAGIMAQYEESFWPMGKGERAMPVIDLRRQDGRGTRRLFSGQNLHDAGVMPFDLLFVHPERRAGSVNPFLLTESLTMVKSQILEFAREHQSFEVQANSQDVPTEYLIRFRAPGFAPGSPPRRIDEHEVLLVLPPDFPVRAPEAYFQRPVFHPNVEPKTGLVCLGVLAESYRPGLHFGLLCQMLIDMASFRNYELREGYNPEAAVWAGSPEGQQAIAEIGGRAFFEMNDRGNRKARALRIERLSA